MKLLCSHPSWTVRRTFLQFYRVLLLRADIPTGTPTITIGPSMEISGSPSLPLVEVAFVE